METNDAAKPIVWYGPHACSDCGVLIIKAAHDQGGEELEPPARLLRVFHRGSEAGDPDLVYPHAWAPHVHLAADDPRRPPSPAPSAARPKEPAE